jgi:hypothetical protein
MKFSLMNNIVLAYLQPLLLLMYFFTTMYKLIQWQYVWPSAHVDALA